jgi:hypothetical protein
MVVKLILYPDKSLSDAFCQLRFLLIAPAV